MGLYDAERAAKIAGARFSILKGDLARLERALIQFFLDTAEDNGYTEVLVPYIVNRDTMTGLVSYQSLKKICSNSPLRLVGKTDF